MSRHQAFKLISMYRIQPIRTGTFFTHTKNIRMIALKELLETDDGLELPKMVYACIIHTIIYKGSFLTVEIIELTQC